MRTKAIQTYLVLNMSEALFTGVRGRGILRR